MFGKNFFWAGHTLFMKLYLRRTLVQFIILFGFIEAEIVDEKIKRNIYSLLHSMIYRKTSLLHAE